jgi:hypothetical protein
VLNRRHKTNTFVLNYKNQAALVLHRHYNKYYKKNQKRIRNRIKIHMMSFSSVDIIKNLSALKLRFPLKKNSTK